MKVTHESYIEKLQKRSITERSFESYTRKLHESYMKVT